MNKLLNKISVKNIGWEPYIYLVYLGFLLFQPSFDEQPLWLDALIVIALLAVFLPAYFASFLDKKNGLIYIAIITLLGLVGMYFNTGSSVFFIYAAAATGYLDSFKKAIRIVIFITLLVIVSAIFSPIPMPWRLWAYGPGVIFTILIGIVGVFQQEKWRANAKLRLAQEEIEQLATVAERERIARDLHDLLGHTLSIITLKSELAYRLIDMDKEKAKQEIKAIEDISRKTLQEVRSAISGYRSRGLLAELSNAKLTLDLAKIDFEYSGDLSLFSPLQEVSLGLIVREAITNIVRHSKASKAYANVLLKGSNIIFEMADNGIGMKDEEGNGLRGMRERIEALNGTVSISSKKGMSLVISLPIDLEEAGRLKIAEKL